MKKIKCGVVGIGYLGKFHADKYSQLSNAELVAVCDVDQNQCHEINAKYPNILTMQDYHQLVGVVDAVSIVAPTQLHYEIAKFFLENKIHTLVEKPICTTVAQAEELITIAKQYNLVLQVGHLERFNTVVTALDKYLDKPMFIESIRIAPFNLRGSDVNVVLDLMIHDIDLIQFLAKSTVKKIYANGACVLSNQIDIANARIEFKNGCVANVTANRVNLKQIRKLRVFQQENYISLDLIQKQLKLHRKGTNEMFPGIPEIISEEQIFQQGDAIKEEITAFIDSILTGKPAIVSGEDGKNALATAIKITDIVHEQMSQTFSTEE